MQRLAQWLYQPESAGAFRSNQLLMIHGHVPEEPCQECQWTLVGEDGHPNCQAMSSAAYLILSFSVTRFALALESEMHQVLAIRHLLLVLLSCRTCIPWISYDLGLDLQSLDNDCRACNDGSSIGC